MSETMNGADGFLWEYNISEDDKLLAGYAEAEWWREVDNNPGHWWRITSERNYPADDLKFFLRLWENDEQVHRKVLKASGFAPCDSIARAQEKARDYELK